MSQPLPEDRQTVLLLGASNLTLGWKPALKALSDTVPGPLDVRVSLGMGRSYVDWSGFWLRRLPGIVNCGLWDSLQDSGSKPPLVLITDLGNDIVYGGAGADTARNSAAKNHASERFERVELLFFRVHGFVFAG